MMIKEALLLLRSAVRGRLPAAADWAPAIAQTLKTSSRNLFGSSKPNDWDTRSFSEKIAWRCRNPDPEVDYATWVDKYRVKHLVGALFDVADTYLVVYDPVDIDASRLPTTFVMKATHGWNMSLLVEDGIVRGGNRTTEGAGLIADSRYLQQVASNWFGSSDERGRRRQEQHYRQVKPGVLFEQSLVPIDYEVQFFLFRGQCRFAMVFFRGFHHTNGSHRLYAENWVQLDPAPGHAASRERSEDEIAHPPEALFGKLKRLCQSIDHVRADFFVCRGTYYFSEFTFTHNGLGGPGLIGKYDAEFGKFWPR